MNNCKDCSLEDCIDSGVDTPTKNCESFTLRDLTEFEKSIVRHGIICGLIIGFLFGLSITWSLWRIFP